MDGCWVAAIPIRKAAERAVTLVAVPVECVDRGALPFAPNGAGATAEVGATAGCTRCRVAYLALPDEELADAVATREMLESAGYEIVGFGPSQSLEPR